jgi:hypothetical protein
MGITDKPLKKPLRRYTERANKRREQGLPVNTPRSVIKVAECIEIALDRVGGADFFTTLAVSKSPEDRRCFALICAKLIPTKVQGNINENLTVKIVKQVYNVIDQNEKEVEPIALADIHEAAEMEQ